MKEAVQGQGDRLFSSTHVTTPPWWVKNLFEPIRWTESKRKEQ